MSTDIRIAALYTYPVKGCHALEHDGALVEPAGLAGDRRWMVVDPDGVGITQRENAALVTLRAMPRPGGLLLTAAGRPDLDVPEPVDGTVGVRVFHHRGEVPARCAGAAADAWLSTLLGRPARLVWLAQPAPLPEQRLLRTADDTVSFADAYPVLLANEASLAALNDWLIEDGDEPVPMTRFRPNVVLTGAAPWAEDDWVGRRIQLGDVLFRAAEGCDRCVVTTIDQETGEKGRQPLRVLGRHRRFAQGLLFGVTLIPDLPPGCTAAIRVGDPLRTG